LVLQTVTVIDTIFHRVNVEEEFDMKLVVEAEERQAAIAAAEIRRARRARRRAGHRLSVGKSPTLSAGRYGASFNTCRAFPPPLLSIHH
jgi:hypothetical protein